MGKDAARKPFTAEEAVKIRDQLAFPGDTMVCPACGGTLILEQPAEGVSSTAYWDIYCPACGRGQILQDLL